MTLLPNDEWHEVEILRELGTYKANEICSVPGCSSPAEHGHHIWRRSFTGAPTHWVRIGEHDVGNVTGLCAMHHDWVTGGIGGHRAWIRWDGQYEWWERGYLAAGEEKWDFVGLLDPQPPMGKPAPPNGHDHDAEICPACGHRKERKKKEPAGEPGVKRPKTKIVFTVPKDNLENGEEVVRTLMDAWKKVVNRDHEHSDYYALVDLLVFGNQHAHLLTKGGAQ